MAGVNVYIPAVEMAGAIESTDGVTCIVLLIDGSYCEVSPDMIEVLH